MYPQINLSGKNYKIVSIPDLCTLTYFKNVDVESFNIELGSKLYQIHFYEGRNVNEMYEDFPNTITSVIDKCAPQMVINAYLKIVNEYDQEIPQSQTADNPVAPRGRAAQPS